MNSEWREVLLGDLIELQTGFPFKSKHYVEDAGVRLLRGDNVVQGTIRWANAKLWPADDLDSHEQYLLHEGDVVLAMDRPWIAVGLKYARIKSSDTPALLVQRVARIRGRSGTDTRYIGYIIGSYDFTGYVLSIQTGTAVPHISGTQIKNYRLKVPGFDTQRAIAKILGDLDDKIDLLREMNATLEEMARAVFRAWFVDFLPVRAKAAGATSFRGMPQALFDQLPTTFTDSELGEIPSGWTVGELSELIDVNPTRTLKKGTTSTYLGMSDVPTSGPTAESWALREFTSGMRFQSGDTLLARITPCLENGKTALVDFLADREIGWGSTEFIVLGPKNATTKEFIYCLARNEKFREFAIKNMTGTSGRQRVSQESISSYGMTKPPTDFQSSFGSMAAPLFDRISANRDEMALLAALRDTLLPKFISGELPAPDLEALGLTPTEPVEASDGG